MPTNEQRRAAAKRKLERQLERRVRHAKFRKKLLISSGATVIVIALVVVGVVLYNNHQDAVAAEQAAAYKANTCQYTKGKPAPKGKDVGLPPNPNPKPTTGTVKVDLKTSQGEIPLTLDRTKAPCTVQSALHLVTKKFYDNTPCHRLTDASSLKVLQCGDPTGTGTGGPGYTIPDEKPSHLKPAPAAIAKQAAQSGVKVATYPRGTVAMANTGQPHSGGSQFFLVYGDSYLPPSYTVFGTIGKAGLATLDKIAKGGITPVANPQTGKANPGDGKPKLPVTIKTATMVS